MKALFSAVLVCGTFALGIPSACVVENGPAQPLAPPAAPRPPVSAPPPATDAATEVGLSEASAPTDAAAGSDASLVGPDSASAGLSPSFLTCTVDADCVAVKKNGCCNNGYKDAVNASSVAAYQASFVCPEPHPICPMFRIRDERTPECSKTTHECELVKR